MLSVLCVPESVCRHCPERMSQILTVESALPDTRMLSFSSMPAETSAPSANLPTGRVGGLVRACLQVPEVRDWCPMSESMSACTLGEGLVSHE